MINMILCNCNCFCGSLHCQHLLPVAILASLDHSYGLDLNKAKLLIPQTSLPPSILPDTLVLSPSNIWTFLCSFSLKNRSIFSRCHIRSEVIFSFYNCLECRIFKINQSKIFIKIRNKYMKVNTKYLSIHIKITHMEIWTIWALLKGNNTPHRYK